MNARALKRQDTRNSTSPILDEWALHVQRTTVTPEQFEKLKTAFEKEAKPNDALRAAFRRNRR